MQVRLNLNASPPKEIPLYVFQSSCHSSKENLFNKISHPVIQPSQKRWNTMLDLKIPTIVFFQILPKRQWNRDPKISAIMLTKLHFLTLKTAPKLF